MAIWKLGGLACAAMLGWAVLIGPASAMPANGLATVASKNITSNIQDVRLVCGPYRCWNTWGPRRWGANRWGWGRGLYAYAGPYMGWRRPLYAYAGWRGPAWGWRRPLYAYAGGVPYWGWRRPLYAAAVTTGIGFNPGYAGFNPWYGGAAYAYAGWNTGWRGWGMSYW